MMDLKAGIIRWQFRDLCALEAIFTCSRSLPFGSIIPLFLASTIGLSFSPPKLSRESYNVIYRLLWPGVFTVSCTVIHYR